MSISLPTNDVPMSASISADDLMILALAGAASTLEGVARQLDGLPLGDLYRRAGAQVRAIADEDVVGAFLAALAPYRDRAATLTEDIINGRPSALDEACALEVDLEDRFVRPLHAAYKALPFDARSGGCSLQDSDTRDGIWHVVHGLAGVTEVSVLSAMIIDGADAGDNASGRTRELVDLADRWRERFAPAGARSELTT